MELTKFAIFALLVTAGYLSFYQNEKNVISNTQSQLFEQFQNWKQEHGIVYNSEQENVYRLNVFIKNLEFIQQYNFEHGDDYLGLNILAGLTNEEYRETYLNNYYQENQQQETGRKLLKQAPIYVKNQEDGEFPMTNNWVVKGAVGPVYDRGGCTASWAIGAAEALTGIYQIRGNPLTIMSPQQIVSCDTLSAGCRGGAEEYAYIYTLQNGIMSEESYPYVHKTGQCEYNKSDVVFHNEDALEIRWDDTYTIQKYSLQQPLTARINGNDQAFQLWRGGEGKVFNTYCDSQETNLTVLIVGYNDQSGKDENDKKIYPYYLVKNSYGTKWGDQGYINMYKAPSGTGQCGLYTRVTFPGYGI